MPHPRAELVDHSALSADILDFAPGLLEPGALLDHVVDIHLGSAAHSLCRFGGDEFSQVRQHGDVDILPAGLVATWELQAPSRALLIQLPPAVLSNTAQTLGFEAQELQLALQVRDPRILHIGLAMQQERAAGSPSGRIFTDSLLTALATRLVQGQGSVTSDRTMPAKLQAWRLRRVTEYVDAHLDQDLSLAELAAVAGFSVSHFKPLFKRATGVTVHQYVIERRVARAQHLLLTADKSLSEIALEAGFTHQSHMARWLRRRRGTTPSVLAARRLLDAGANAPTGS